ncbi:nucleotidyltransferase family protein [soil metagenome]
MRKQVLILAGGLGTRLRPITETCPKPMVPVAGEPFLHWQILDLKEQGYTDIVLLVSYLGEQVQSHFGDGSKWGVDIKYSFETEPLGTGGAVLLAIQALGEDLDDDFMILNGDSFLRAPLDDVSGFFEEGIFDAVVTTYDNGLKSGLEKTPVPNNLKVKNQMVVAYEKAAGIEKGFDCVDSGIYVVKKSLFVGEKGQPVARATKFQLEDVLHRLIEKRTFGAFKVDSRFFDIGTAQRLKEFEDFVRSECAAGRLHGREPEGVR